MCKVTLDAKGFETAVRYAIKAAVKDSSRTALEHILFDISQGQLNIVSADGFRLHRTMFEVSVQDGQWLYHKDDLLAVIQDWRKTVKVRKGSSVEVVLEDEGQLTVGGVVAPTDNWGRYESKEWVTPRYGGSFKRGLGRGYYETKVIVERPHYPNWREIWPLNGSEVVVPLNETLAVFKALVQRAKEGYKETEWSQVKPYFPCALVSVQDGKMTVSLRVAEGTVGAEALGDPVIGSVEAKGELETFAVDAKYVIDSLYGVSGKSMTVRMEKASCPMVVAEQAVIMPVHIEVAK